MRTTNCSTIPDVDAEVLVGLSDAELAEVDPLFLDLCVARGIPSLSAIDIGRYTKVVDAWAKEFTVWAGPVEDDFRQSPEKYGNDLAHLQLGLLYQFMDQFLHMAYREDQRHLDRVRYTDPNDLFLTGVIDTRRGTCGNMATLYHALAWRLGWPVSLAHAHAHVFAMYSDRGTTINVEVTTLGVYDGANFKTTASYQQEYRIPPIAIECGSDLRPLRPREVFGLFFGHRGRHLKDIGALQAAEQSYLWARALCPSSRYFMNALAVLMIRLSPTRFAAHEEGHALEVDRWPSAMVSQSCTLPVDVMDMAFEGTDRVFVGR